MKPLFFILFFTYTSIAFLYAQEKNFKIPIQITKEEFLLFKDIKPLLEAANPDKNFAPYVVRSFILNFSRTDTTIFPDITFSSFTESAPCGSFTNKQRTLILKYSKQRVVFTLEKISMLDPAEPGTPYPDAQKIITAPNVSFTINE